MVDYLFELICIYVKLVLELIENIDVYVIVYFIGGGFWENILCVLLENIQVVINELFW